MDILLKFIIIILGIFMSFDYSNRVHHHIENIGFEDLIRQYITTHRQTPAKSITREDRIKSIIQLFNSTVNLKAPNTNDAVNFLKKELKKLKEEKIITKPLLQLLEMVYLTAHIKSQRETSEHTSLSNTHRVASSIVNPSDTNLIHNSVPKQNIGSSSGILYTPFTFCTYATEFFYKDNNYVGCTPSQIELIKYYDEFHGYGKLQLYLKEKKLTAHMTELEAVEAVRKAAYRFNKHPYSLQSKITPNQFIQLHGLQFLYGPAMYQFQRNP